MKNKPIPRVCGSCAYLVTQEGEPYYCAIKDLYAFRKKSDKACWEFTLPKTMGTIDVQIKLLGASESTAPTPETPLSPYEIAILQEIYTSLNRQCAQLCAINEGTQEREEAIRKQSLNSGCGDSEARTEAEAIAERLRLNGIVDVNPDEIVLGHQDSSGLRGCNPYTLIGSIMMDLLRAQDKIERLIRKELPQTKSALESLLSSLHLSDGGSIHERTDKSTDTKNCLWSKDI